MPYRLRTDSFVILMSVALALSGCASSPALKDSLDPRNADLIELTDTPFFPQESQQCGPASLAMLLSAAGKPTDPAELVDEIFLPKREGTLSIEIVAAARSRGLLPYTIDPNVAALWNELNVGRPVLVMQNLGLRSWPKWHYAVVIGYNAEKNEVTLRSGTTAVKRMSLRTFERTWMFADRWGLILLPPGTIPSNADLIRYMTAAAGFEALGNHDAAAAAYAGARRAWPQSALPLLGLANIAYAREDWAHAQAWYEQVIAIEPDHAIAYNNLADTLVQRGCATDAAHAIERALSLTADATLRAAFEATAQRVRALPPDSRCQIAR
jgi:tetratricopeptide (TPR) repeat protein